jgi:glycosyltransferase involved in cell wall biosynthesis
LSRCDFEAHGTSFNPVRAGAAAMVERTFAIRGLAAAADVVHAHGARAALPARAAVASLGRSRPRLVYSIHGFAAPFYRQPRRGLLLALERLLSRHTDRFIAVCDAERSAIVEAGIAEPQRISVVKNAIDPARVQTPASLRPALRQSFGIAGDGFVLASVSRLHRPRDFESLLEAFRRVAERFADARLLVAGDGPERAAVERRIRILSLESRVTLLGWQPDVARVYGASDACVLTSSGWEGLPLSLLEAMAAGLPVVATQAGGTLEAVDPEVSGLVVPRRSPEALAHALCRLASDPGLRRRMGEAGRRRATLEFSLARMVQETEAVYDQVLAG